MPTDCSSVYVLRRLTVGKRVKEIAMPSTNGMRFTPAGEISCSIARCPMAALKIYTLLSMSSIAGAAGVEDYRLERLVDLPFEELLNLPITSTSYFPETPLHAASTVTVIPRSDWEKRGARRLPDAFSNLPGVVSLPNFLGSYATLIRGYAQSDARGVATLWDGASINSFNLSTADVDRPNIQLGTLESIEVIRGPGSVHYGTDAFHGVISLTAFESETDINRLSARVASNGFYSSAYNGSTALNEDWRLNASIAGSGQPDQDRDYTFTDGGTGLRGSGEREYKYDSITGVLKLASDKSNKLSYKAGIYFDNIDQDNFHGEGGLGFFPQNDVASVDSDFVMGKFTAKYTLNDTSSIEFDVYRWDQSHRFERPVTAANTIKIDTDENRMAAKLVYRNDRLTDNTQFSAAVEIRQDEIENASRRIFNSSMTLVDADLPFSGVDRNIKSIEASAKTEITGKPWLFHYGFRLDDYESFGSKFTPRLGVVYQIDQQSVAKALYGKAFRAPNAIELGGTPFITGDPDLDPETIDTIELAYMKQTGDAKLEAVLFSSKWKNAISSIDTDNDASVDTFTNLSDNDAYGVEVTYLRKLDDWLIETSGSYVKSENDETGTEFKAFPKYIVNLGLGYEFSQGWLVYLNNRVHLGADEGPERENVQSDSLKDYWRTDLHIGKNFKKRWKMFVNVRNLFDRGNYLPSLVNAEGGIQDEEFSIDAGLSYSFQGAK